MITKKVLRVLSLALVISTLAVAAFANSYVPSIEQKKAMGVKTVTVTLEDGKEVKYPAADVVVTPLVDGDKLSEEDQKLLDEACDSIPEAGSIREAAPFVALAGEAKKGDEFMEFCADEAALAQTVQDIFYRSGFWLRCGSPGSGTIFWGLDERPSGFSQPFPGCAASGKGCDAAALGGPGAGYGLGEGFGGGLALAAAALVPGVTRAAALSQMPADLRSMGMDGMDDFRQEARTAGAQSKESNGLFPKRML